VTVLGSGNMDRASWYTSQELGIAFFSTDLATQLSQSVENALKDRVKYAYQLSI
jgi:phosphatidylserine/phosphatidylglycerophosphate/cardiolipin synthase-like enzyme